MVSSSESSDIASTTEEQTASTEVVLNMVHEIKDDANKIENQGKGIFGISKDLQSFVESLEKYINEFNI